MPEIRLDTRVAELLCARLCHDLISPIGAVSNGLELMAEFGDDGEAMGLVRSSAEAAGKKLRFFRIAYGFAGGGAGVSLAEAAGVAGAVETPRINVVWGKEHQPDTPAPGAAKLLLNMVLLATECLPRGGTVRVKAEPGPGGLGVEAVAEPETGEARLSDEAAAALAGEAAPAALTPRTVQAHYTRLLADQLACGLEAQYTNKSGLRLAGILPAQE